MMKKLINFFKKLLGCEEACPKCKSNPCKCEPEIPAEHIRTVESTRVREEVPTCEFPGDSTKEPVKAGCSVKVPVEEPKEEVKVAAPKKKRAPRKKKAESEKK